MRHRDLAVERKHLTEMQQVQSALASEISAAIPGLQSELVAKLSAKQIALQQKKAASDPTVQALNSDISVLEQQLSAKERQRDLANRRAAVSLVDTVHLPINQAHVLNSL